MDSGQRLITGGFVNSNYLLTVNPFSIKGLEKGGVRAQLDALLKELSPDKTVTSEAFERILKPDHRSMYPMFIFAVDSAMENLELVGYGEIHVLKRVTGKTGVIHTVVVKSNHRGHGVGRLLVGKLLEIARHLGIGYVSLASRNHRQAAHALYTAMGFKKKETDVFEILL